MKTKKSKDGIKGYLGAITLVLGIHIFLYQPFKIPSESMMPTLLVGDFIFVSKFAYGYSRYSVFFQPGFIDRSVEFNKPKCGDVAVFFHEFKEEKEALRYDFGIFGGFFQKLFRSIRKKLAIPQKGVSYVKRVIGLPGDKIQMKEGNLFINNEKIKLDYVGEYPIENQRGLIIAKEYLETLPSGKQHSILKIFDFGKAHLDNTQEFEVPADHYFMMGDNRDNSEDSRASVGFVHKELLIGQPQIIFFSTKAKWYEIHKWIFDLRPSRIFNLIK